MDDAWAGLKYVAVDVEGNGQRPPDLVEVAVVPVEAGVVGAPASWLVRPPRPILPMARRFHRITDDEVAHAPTIWQVSEEVREALDGAVFVAHSAHVDLGVLTRELPGFEPCGVVDTLKLARRALPDRDSYTLGALAADLGLTDGLPEGLAPHRATYDALVCARLLVHLGPHLDIDELTREADHEALF